MKYLVLLLLGLANAEAKVVHYELKATRGEVNLSGNKTVDFALMLNGSIPAPTLEFTEGDDAEIVVKNEIPGEELSVHWHGMLLPVEMDGVPYVTTPSIHTGESYTFRFKLRQNGTYWYHSHTNIQEQKGLYGAFVIHPKKETIKSDREIVAVLSDWSDENPTNILKNLRKDGDYYLYKKGTVRSWFGAIGEGKLGNYLHNEWTRMGGMDLSDVGYDAFLINGKRDAQLAELKAGQRVRLRLINASASSYLYVTLGQTAMHVISADGVDIEPVMAKKLLMGMAETYDVLFTVPEQKNYELKISVQDGTGSGSAWIGSGEKVFAPIEPKPDQYATMDHSAHAGHAGHGEHSAMRTVEMLTVDEVRAKEKTTLPVKAPVHEWKLKLGGDMNRYIWFINGKAIHEERNIEVNEGDVVRITFENETMMHHPMHLHGHFFRVLTAAGEYSPLKHTVDVPPHGTRVIEFHAVERGEWMLHCHNLYHMKNGMGRIVKYTSYTPSAELQHLQHQDPHHHDHLYYYGRAELATNHAQAYLRMSQTWSQWEGRVEGRNTTKSFSFGEPWELEVDLFYRRWFGNYFNLVGGGTLFDEKFSAAAGFAYRLPMLIETQFLVNHRGKFRVNIAKKFQWTSSIFTDVDLIWRPAQAEILGEDLEFEATLMYGPAWNWSAGLMFTDQSIGAGLQVQF